MKRVIDAPEAEADVYSLARHIADDADLPAAHRFIDVIDEAAHLIATQPEMGRKRDELAPRLTSVPGWFRTYGLTHFQRNRDYGQPHAARSPSSWGHGSTRPCR